MMMLFVALDLINDVCNETRESERGKNESFISVAIRHAFRFMKSF